MQKKSTFRKILSIGVASLLLAVSLATLPSVSTGNQFKYLQAAFDFGLETDDFSIGVGNGGGSNNQPGCDGGNCLSIPDDGLYKGIAGETNIRQAIINWTNFALGFLSLIAMVALIFAGFMYVTSAGEDEQAGKAKKMIMYVVIGIIVILIAYALVNTLITDGPKGGDLVAAVLNSVK
jgi:type IV secretory pathway VirB2 component (pilin)